MPFKSKAQQRLFFAKNPKKAKEWAKETPNMKDLPEKKHPQINPDRKPLRTKIAGDGMFFQKAAQARAGHFFRDLPGRTDGTFHEKSANALMGYGADAAAPAVDMQMNVAPPPPTEAGGGMYGTGQPAR